MAITNIRIGPIVAGEDKQIILRVPQIPTGRTVTDAYLQVGSKLGVPVSDDSVLFSRHITTSPAAEGQILDIGSSGIASLNFLLPSDITALFWPLPAGVTDWLVNVQTVLDNGSNGYPVRGILSVEPPLIVPVIVP